MKTAIYIEDGVVQLVLTPESDFEKNVLKEFKNKDLKTEIFSGTFYDCRGGWVRQSQYYNKHQFSTTIQDEQSLIIKTSTGEIPSERD